LFLFFAEVFVSGVGLMRKNKSRFGVICIVCVCVLWNIRFATKKTSQQPLVAKPTVAARGCEYGCDCPSTHGKQFSVTEACALVRNKTLLFAGDSLMRDLWTTASLFLLKNEGFDAQALAGEWACMACAWKYLEPAGIRTMLLKRGFLQEYLTSQESVYTMHACGARLIFRYGRLFSDAPAWVREAQNQHANLFVMSHGILEMSDYNAKTKPPWDTWLSTFDPSTTVYMGAHYRNAEQSPKPYQEVARTHQGNAKIKEWTTAVRARNRLHVLDPYNITANLGPHYRDTDDGLHFGYWVNLQKFYMILNLL